MPYKIFAANEEALAADVNNYLMSQTVSRHTSASARASAITAPTKGQMSVLDTDVFDQQVYTGSIWASVGPVAMRWFHLTGIGNIGPTATINIPFPGFTYPRDCTAILQIQAYATLGSGSGAGNWNFSAISNGSVAPTIAPVSLMGGNPTFNGGTIPITAIYRNVAAGVSLGPQIQAAGAGGSAIMNLGALSGYMLFMPPNAEF